MTTENAIKQRMLNNTPSDLDSREGAFIYDSVSPVALELAQTYVTLGVNEDKYFIDTTYGTYLDRKVAEQGLTRKPAVAASGNVTITGQEGSAIYIGDKVSSSSAAYTVTEGKVIGITGTETILIECDIAGIIGNCPPGAINFFPLALPGISSVTNNDAFDNGYDAETDKELRERYYEKVRTPPTSGNKSHYINWAKEIVGVGDAKVYPLWDGNGTVKVVLIDSNKTGVDQSLIDEVAEHIEDNRPIGATVTVLSATELPIDVSATLTISSDYTIEQVKTNIEMGITDHLKEIAFISAYVSYAKIGSIIMSSAGVLDYSSLLVNAGTVNVTIGDEQVAVLGTVTIS